MLEIKPGPCRPFLGTLAHVKRYLPKLQTRNKWMTETGKTLKTGIVVMIVDHQLPRALWPVGKVSATVPGADGNIWTAKVYVSYRVRNTSDQWVSLPPLPDDDKDFQKSFFAMLYKQISTVIQAVHSLLYIVAKCNFFSVVTWKDIIKYLQKMWGVFSLLWDTVYLNMFFKFVHISVFNHSDIYILGVGID